MFVYVIVNSETLKIYIGQHKGLNLGKYLSRKFWDANHHTTGTRSHLYSSMRRYPREAWGIHPLIAGIKDRKELDEWEQMLIYTLKAQHPDVGYNICDGGEGFTGTHTKETRKKLSIANMGHSVSEETRKKISENMGPKPEGFGEKISHALTGRTWTPKQREKIPEAIRQAQLEGRMHQFTLAEKAKARQAVKANLTGVPRPAHVMAAFHSPEAQAKAAASRRGKPLSDEHRSHLSAARRQWWATRKANASVCIGAV